VGTLEGKGALVTGGSRGIGRAIVKRLADDGASVVFSYAANADAAASVVSEVTDAGGRALAVRADQGRTDDLLRLTAQVEDWLDGLDIVSPGATDTEMLRAANPGETFEDDVARTALKRLGQPEDIARVVAFLAGPDSGWISGQNLSATGGYLP
jgi:3-oxoacyl-[acyl-carrier protein] reductase